MGVENIEQLKLDPCSDYGHHGRDVCVACGLRLTDEDDKDDSETDGSRG